MNMAPRKLLFEKVKESLIKAIMENSFMPGDMLPPMRELVAQYNVSMVTMKRVINELKEEDWVVSVPRHGIIVADPLPEISHLYYLRKKKRNQMTKQNDLLGFENGTGKNRTATLKCVIHDKLFLPLFEWAAKRYDESLNSIDIEFKINSLRGSEDEEILEDDLMILPTYYIGRLANKGKLTPVEDICDDVKSRTANIIPELLELSTMNNQLWGIPICAGGGFFMYNKFLAEKSGIAMFNDKSLNDILDYIDNNFPETDNELSDVNPSMYIRYLLSMIVAAGYDLEKIADIPAIFKNKEVKKLLERLRQLAINNRVMIQRLDKENPVDLAEYTFINASPEWTNKSFKLLDFPADNKGKLLLATYCICVNSNSLHPFEAWNWAFELIKPEFQKQIAGLGYEIPISTDLDVWNSFGDKIGHEKSSVYRKLLKRPSSLYKLRKENIVIYLWEVLLHELYVYIRGKTDYPDLLKRLKVKTERFVAREI